MLFRSRYDQFMKLGWKILIPVSLIWILLVAAIRTLTTEVPSTQTRLTYIGIAVVVLFAIFFAIPQSEPATDEQLEADNGLAAVTDGGFPLPPLDLVVPPTPRSLQSASIAVAPAAAPTTQDEVVRG